jgi:hypothetical protein
MEFHLVDGGGGDEGHATPDGTPLEHLDPQPLLTRDYETRPELVYERLRERHGPVAPVDLLGEPAWLVLGYRQSLRILQDDAAWPKGLENWRARSEGRVPADWPLGPSLEVNHRVGRRTPPLRTVRASRARPPRRPTAVALLAVHAGAARTAGALRDRGAGAATRTGARAGRTGRTRRTGPAGRAAVFAVALPDRVDQAEHLTT